MSAHSQFGEEDGATTQAVNGANENTLIILTRIIHLQKLLLVQKCDTWKVMHLFWALAPYCGHMNPVFSNVSSAALKLK